jgi:phosphoserine phosphatase RsbU/P
MRSSWDRINELRRPGYFVQPPFDLGDFAEALNLQREAEAAGIRAGDVVTGIEGRPIEGLSDFHSAIRQAKVGDRLRLQVRTGDDANAVPTDISIELQAYPDLGISEFTATLFVWVFLVVMPLFCISLGFWVAAVRIQDRAAWLLLVLLLSISAIIGTTPRTQFGNTDTIQPVLTAYRLFLNNLAPAALVFFAIGFPDRLQLDRKYPWIKWVIFGPLILRVAAGALMAVIEMHHLDIAHRYWNLYARLLSLDLLQIVAMAGFFAILGYKTLTTSDRDARRRLLLLDAAGAVGFIPPMVVVLLNVMGVLRIEGWIAAVFLTMLAFPLTMAYVTSCDGCSGRRATGLAICARARRHSRDPAGACHRSDLCCHVAPGQKPKHRHNARGARDCRNGRDRYCRRTICRSSS